jgi:hypothetical protein
LNRRTVAACTRVDWCSGARAKKTRQLRRIARRSAPALIKRPEGNRNWGHSCGRAWLKGYQSIWLLRRPRSSHRKARATT